MYKIRNYTEEQVQYIVDNYITMTAEDIAKEINKSVQGVGHVARKLGLLKQQHKPWTEEEKQYLRDNYIEKTSEEIAKILGRTVHSINAERDRQGLVRNENWNQEDINFLKENFEKMTHKEIGKRLNRTTQAITAKCFDLDLYKKELPWNQEEIDFVKDNYMEMPTSDISKILNRTISAVKIKARKLGLKKYPYICDYHYFDVINTEEKAYWLGFLIADGWINKSKKNNAGAIGIELQYGDIDHLKKFNKSIKGNYKITDRWRTLSYQNINKKHHMCMIRIFSIIMYESLVQLGFTNNKSFDCNFPNINNDLLKHFIRGYFDGDGCFSYVNNRISVSFITASYNMRNNIIDLLHNHKIDFSENNYINEYNTPMHRIEITKNKEKIKFLDWMYKDCNIYLDRKYNKYLKIKDDMICNESLAN